MRKRIVALLLTLLTIVSFAANKRVVSLSPAMTETIFMFGYGDTLVGRTDFCTRPAEVAKITSVGTMMNPNIEKILSLKPDYVIASGFLDPKVVKQLNDMKVETLVVETPKSINDMYAGFEKIITILDSKEAAAAKINPLKAKVESVKKLAGALTTKPKFYFAVGTGNTEYGAGKDTFISDVLTTAGGVNAMKNDGWVMPLENLIAEQPAIIITDADTAKAMKASSKLSSLKAIKENKMLIIDKELGSLASPRIILEGLDTFYKGFLNSASK